MPLSRDTPLTKDDIASVVELKEYKVFLLIGPADEKLVLKTDANITAAQVKSATSVTKAIDPSVKSKILSDPEKKEINAWIGEWEKMEDWFRTNLGKEYRAEEKETVKNLKDMLNYPAPEPWLKMEALEVKDLDGALEKRLSGDKSEIKQFTAALTAKGGLEKLGQVIAADMFNGNTDRFLPADKTSRTQTIAGRKFAFRALINMKNVFIVTSKAGYEVSALDYIDPQSQFKDVTASLAGTQWPAMVLVEKKSREAFAADVAHDLELIVNPNKNKLTPFSKLGRDAAPRIAAGMVMGAGAIKKKLEAKYKTMTGGVKERYDVLCKVK